MRKIAVWSSSFAVLLLWSLSISLVPIQAAKFASFGPLVTKESRKTIASTEFGEITAVDLHDGYSREAYHLEFITLDTGSLFLPVFLHTDMLFYVQSGRGMVNAISTESGGTKSVEVRKGDIYRLEEGTVFYVQSYPDPARKEKLRIHSIFYPILNLDPDNPLGALGGAYSNISDLVRGFDDEILQMAFGVSKEDIRGIKWVVKPPPIVYVEPKNETKEMNWKDEIFEALVGRRPLSFVNGKKKKKKEKKEKTQTFNIFDAEPDVENCNGRSVSVTSDDYKPLLDSDIGFFMVNLTKGSMMGPHWNPWATEIAVVTHGQGIVQIVCPVDPSGVGGESIKCKNTKFRVKEGDIFIVPRYHPMSQISYNNGSFVFVGFTTMVRQNHPQFLVGQRSVLKTLDRNILALSFNVANTSMIDRLVDSQIESIMFECTSCAEELEMKMIEEEAKRREEEEQKKREEEAKKREEEIRKRKEEEEEEERKREEEERKRREEEAKKREEEERQREQEEEEAREEEEEKERKREEEERKRKEEEEAKKREEEERQREQEEKEARQREQEEARQREQEEARQEEEARQREQEEVRRKEQEEEARQEEDARRREQEEEEARHSEEEEEEARRREEGGGADKSREPASAPGNGDP